MKLLAIIGIVFAIGLMAAVRGRLEIAEGGGTPEMNSGALHRYLAEAVWYPWALVPSEALRWGRFNRRCEQVAWEGHFSDYQQRDGVLAPSEGEVVWYRNGQLQIVWRGTVVDYVAASPGATY